MHGVAHVLTGWLIGDYFGGSVLENTLLGVLAVIVDADGAKLRFFDALDCIKVGHGIDGCAFTHAVFTHTLAWCGAVLVVTLAAVWWWRGYTGMQATAKALAPSVIAYAILSHLLLDVWTYNKPCGDTHQYLWPVSRFSFHLNCIFDGSDTVQRVRAFGEWAVYHPVVWALVAYRAVAVARLAAARHAINNPTAATRWKQRYTSVALIVVFLIAPAVYAFDPFGDGALCLPFLCWLFWPFTPEGYTVVNPPDDAAEIAEHGDATRQGFPPFSKF